MVIQIAYANWVFIEVFDIQFAYIIAHYDLCWWKDLVIIVALIACVYMKLGML